MGAAEAGVAPALGVPSVVVSGQHAAGPKPLGLEGEEAVPRADVENRLAAEVSGQLDPVELLGGVPLEAGGDQVVAQPDRVEPADPLDLVSEQVVRPPRDDYQTPAPGGRRSASARGGER